MDFGMTEYSGLKKEDFIFNHDKQNCLPGKRDAAPKIYIGLPQWNNKRWAGSLYPEKYKDADTLNYYAEKFNSIELNTTHYAIPGEEQVKKWTAKVNPYFKFYPKFINAVTHKGKIIPETKKHETENFITAIRHFGDNLGGCFLQLKETYAPGWAMADLVRYLKTLPKDISFFVEVRNEEWFSNTVISSFSNNLSAAGIGLVITDTPGKRHTAHLKLTIPKVFVRFVCSGNNETDLFRISEWKRLLKYWFDNGLKECCFFLHVHDDLQAISFASFVQNEFSNV